MTNHISILNVNAHLNGQKIFLGRIHINPKTNQGGFQWSDEAIEQGLEWSPVMLPLSKNLWISGQQERDLMGMPGLIHDSLPDGWGMLLIDRAFHQRGVLKQDVTPLLRLSFLGDRCWGALSFDPQWKKDAPKKYKLAVESLATEATKIIQGETENVSQELLLAGGSPHGARPKIMVGISQDNKNAIVGKEDLPDGWRHVLVKFPGDGENLFTPLFEYAYTEAARRYGIETMPAQHLEIGTMMALCVDRFDRQNGIRQHVHSMAGMLHTTHRIANADWIQVAQILNTLQAGVKEHHQAYRRAVFNAVFFARDDHTKNISFMRHHDHRWGLAPAYDISFCVGPGGWHTMTYANHRQQHVTRDDLVRLAGFFHVDPQDVDGLIEQARDERQNMLSHAQRLGVPSILLDEAVGHYNQADKVMSPHLQSIPKRR